MAHFISLVAKVPGPNDDISALTVRADGTADIGLWGMMDGSTECEVRDISGPGVAKKGDKAGSAIRRWALSKLTPRSCIQAFSGDRPFTAILPVRITPPAVTLAAQNKALLEGADRKERAYLGGASGKDGVRKLVEIEPLRTDNNIGDYKHSPRMERVRGLAVHITDGALSAVGCRDTFDDPKTKGSAHFMIDRGGRITQFVAASIRAQAQGPGNGHFLSVELVSSKSASVMKNGKLVPAPNTLVYQGMTGDQLVSLRALFGWVQKEFGVPPKLATAYSGREKDSMGSGLATIYRAVAAKMAAAGSCAGVSPSIDACIDSWGLSCHWWLDTFAKPCPGLAVMEQLPEVVGLPRIEVDGDWQFIGIG